MPILDFIAGNDVGLGLFGRERIVRVEPRCPHCAVLVNSSDATCAARPAYTYMSRLLPQPTK